MPELQKLKEDERHLWYVLFNFDLPEDVRVVLTRVFADLEQLIRDREGKLVN